jgi:hypothetical protein
MTCTFYVKEAILPCGSVQYIFCQNELKPSGDQPSTRPENWSVSLMTCPAWFKDQSWTGRFYS